MCKTSLVQRRFQLSGWFFALFIGVFFFSLPLMSKESTKDPLKGLKAPTSEWSLRKFKSKELKPGIEEEFEIEVKQKGSAVNIGLRIGKDLPISSHDFLDQVRTQLAASKDYEGAEITFVKSQEAGGKDWDFFTIHRKDQIKQEFWARSISSDKILMVLYTSVGDYFEQYRNDFVKVLERAGRD